jgi:hypothetical protein
MGREEVVAATSGWLDGSTEGLRPSSAEGLAEIFGTWKRVFYEESRRPAAEAGAGQDHRREAPRSILA